MKNVVLVIGATGLTGRYFLDEIKSDSSFKAIGISRKTPEDTQGADFISVDLLEEAETIKALGQLSEVTDIVYAGFVPAPTLAEQIQPNIKMLVNTMKGIQSASGNLRKVTLIQGMKYYGSHLGPFKTPAKEEDPRHMPPNYYYGQQDYLIDAQKTSTWNWTCLRPHVICGHAIGSTQQNLVMVIGMYAAFCKEHNLPFKFPGTEKAYNSIYQATDARILAKAVKWSLINDSCNNQAYNITNGDFFRWSSLWPKIADLFSLKTSSPQLIDLGHHMNSMDRLWDDMVIKHDLKKNKMDNLVYWPFANYIFRTDWDVMASTIKSRKDGFNEFVDSEIMFLELLENLKNQKIIP